MFNSKNVKRIVSISAAAVCMLSLLSIAPADYFIANAEGDMSAFEITENMKIGWNLGNTLDATAGDKNGTFETAGLETETSWGQPKASKELFDAIKAKGFNTVRVPTTWFQHLDADNNIDPEWMARVKEVVDYGIKNDMYVILNLHHENWVNRADLGTAYDVMKPKLLKIWEQINETFGDYDQHLIFECMNEPRAAGTSHEWWGPEDAEVETINKLNADFVNLIRTSDSKYAKTRLLMIPGYCAGSDVSMISLIDIPKDDAYVAASIHAYVPYNFTMNPGKGGQHDTFTTAFSNELAGILDGIRSTFLNKDIPVVIGEFGTSNYENTEARVKWADQYLTTAKKYGIPCVLWDNNVELESKPTGEAHGYINRKTLEWYTEPVKVVDKMMEIINDKTIVWGSERHIPTVEHQAYGDAKTFLEGPYELDAAKEKTYQNTTPGGDGEVEWSQLKGKEVAIKFTGTTPVLCFSDASYGGWTEVKPYEVDETNGIAYYLMAKVPDAWGDDPTTIAHMQAKTTKTTNVDSIKILEAPKGEISEPAPTAKIKKVNLKDAKNTDTLVVSLEGKAGTKTNGALGFMKGDDWTQIEWNGTVDADGKLTVEIPLADAVVGGSAEFQIWANFEDVDIKDVKFVGADAPVETTPAVTTPATSTPAASTPASSATLLGDANCDTIVNISDAVLIMQALANPSKFDVNGSDALHITAVGKANADCCNVGDGVTNKDALAIQKLMLKLIDKLPATDTAE